MLTHRNGLSRSESAVTCFVNKRADDGKQYYTIEYEDNSPEVEIELDAVTGEVCDIELDN